MTDEFATATAKTPFQMPQTDHFQHADGIYFHLPEDDYHADPALGSSGVRDLLQSPLTYWTKSPYNPDRPDDDKKSGALNLGDYVHDLLLHREKFFAVKPEGMSFATKEGKAWRDLHPEGTIIIPEKDHRAAMLIMKALEKAGVKEHFSGGEPEVSFFWTEPGGFRCKIRIDYLRPTDAFDIKTYGNMMNKDTETVIAHAVATHRYHVSAHWYHTGIARMRAMIQAKGMDAIVETPGTRGKHFDLVEQIAQAKGSFPLWFLFMETGGIPNLTIRRFAERDTDGTINAYFRAAKNETDRATGTFARCMKEFGPSEMWIEKAVSKPFTDNEFGAARWILEEV